MMQMPVFLILFFAPVYVPLDLLTGWIEGVAHVNPVTRCSRRRAASSREARRDVLLAFGVASASVAPSRSGRSAACAAPRQQGKAPRRQVAKRSGPASRLLSGRSGTARARTSHCSPSTPSASSSASSTTRTARSASRCPAHGAQLALLPARRRPRPALRLPRPRAMGAERGHRFNPNKLLIDPYAKSVEARFAGTGARRFRTRAATTSSWTKATTQRRSRSAW